MPKNTPAPQRPAATENGGFSAADLMRAYGQVPPSTPSSVPPTMAAEMSMLGIPVANPGESATGAAAPGSVAGGGQGWSGGFPSVKSRDIKGSAPRR